MDRPYGGDYWRAQTGRHAEDVWAGYRGVNFAEVAAEVASDHTGSRCGNNSDVSATKVFVGGLPRGVDKRRIESHFSRFGKLLSVKMPCKEDGTSKGYCFIDFESVESAKKTVIDNYMHNKIDGKWVDCKFLKPRTSDATTARDSDAGQGCWWESTTWHAPAAERNWWQREDFHGERCADASWAAPAPEGGAQVEGGSPWGAPSGSPTEAARTDEPPGPPEPQASDARGSAHASHQAPAQEDGASDLLTGNQPRVFVLDPPESSDLPALLAVLVPDEGENACRQAVCIAEQVLQCMPAQDIKESDEFYACKSWYRQMEIHVDPELICAHTTRFHVAIVIKGPYAGLMAVGVGTNKVKLKRAWCLSLAAAAFVHSHGEVPWMPSSQTFDSICQTAMRLKKQFASLDVASYHAPPRQPAHVSSEEIRIPVDLGRTPLNMTAPHAVRARLLFALKDKSGRQFQQSIMRQWPLSPYTATLLDGLYFLRIEDTIELYAAEAGVWCAKSTTAVEARVDVGSGTLRHLQPGDLCEQAGRAVVLQEVGDDGPVTVLRSCLKPDGWVSLAEWRQKDDDSFDFVSTFHEPSPGDDETSGWQYSNALALHLDHSCEVAFAACARLESLQGAIREAAQQLLQGAIREQASTLALLDSPEVCQRDAARAEAVRALCLYLQAAEESRLCCAPGGWQGAPASDREHRVEEARDLLKGLEKGAAVDARVEVQRLAELRDAARQARIAARRAECDVLDSRDMEEEDADVRQKEKTWRERRCEAQRADKDFQKKMSRLSTLASDHIPEIMPEILAKASTHIKKELSAMKPLDQSRVVDLFAMERCLAHYDEGLDRMEELSRMGARHQVLATGYGGSPCVLKVFELNMQTSVAGFLKEVVLHKKLQHCKLVVPLRQAFLDTGLGSMRGVLHFDRYPCDLDKWGRTMAREDKDPQMAVRCVACKMAQSVANIHVLGIIHGDLKPSNWLFDSKSGMPLLCDFETAKDRGVGGVTTTRVGTTAGPALQTRGYVAPELEADIKRPKSRASDIFALGLSIKFLIDCIADRGTVVSRVGPLGMLLNLVERMTCNDPGERISAQDAQYDPIFKVDDKIVSPEAPPPYWAFRGVYEWHLSEFMRKEVERLLVETTCSECKRYRLATDVRVVKVCRVENRIHWKSFSSRRAELAELAKQDGRATRGLRRSIQVGDIRLDDTTNEVFLWHGLPAANVPIVAHSGLDERIANCRGLYGAGIYLTDQWCKALQYSRAGKCSVRYKQCGQIYRCSCRGPKRVLLCRALLGESYYVQAHDNLVGHRRPPEKASSRPGVVYDSVIAEPGTVVHGGRKPCQVHREVVLFDRKSVYPEWIVELDWDCW